MLPKSILVCLFSTLAIVQSQITPQIESHLVNVAKTEIQKQIVNGSDMKNANLSF